MGVQNVYVSQTLITSSFHQHLPTHQLSNEPTVATCTPNNVRFNPVVHE